MQKKENHIKNFTPLFGSLAMVLLVAFIFGMLSFSQWSASQKPNTNSQAAEKTSNTAIIWNIEFSSNLDERPSSTGRFEVDPNNLALQYSTGNPEPLVSTLPYGDIVSGYQNFLQSGPYELKIAHNGNLKLFIDGEQVYDNQSGVTTQESLRLNITAGNHLMRYEHSASAADNSFITAVWIFKGE